MAGGHKLLDVLIVGNHYIIAFAKKKLYYEIHDWMGTHRINYLCWYCLLMCCITILYWRDWPRFSSSFLLSSIIFHVLYIFYVSQSLITSMLWLLPYQIGVARVPFWLDIFLPHPLPKFPLQFYIRCKKNTLSLYISLSYPLCFSPSLPHLISPCPPLVPSLYFSPTPHH